MLQRKKLSKQCSYNTTNKVVPLFQVTMWSSLCCPSIAKSLLRNNEPPLATGLIFGKQKTIFICQFMADQLPVPLELMELNVSICKTRFNTMRCKCIKNQLIRTYLGKCIWCENFGTEFDVTVHDENREDQLWLSSLLIIL